VVGSVFFVSFVFLIFFFCWGNLGYMFGCDYISFGLILLRFWICVLMVLARERTFRFNYFSCFFFLVLLIILYCTFRSVRLFSFYLFFEGRLIPTLFLVSGWGYQPERLQAGIYLLLYTLLASLPLLVGIISVYNVFSSLCCFYWVVFIYLVFFFTFV
jgi:NADH-ubiquinone oxidoreductase chain 4